MNNTANDAMKVATTILDQIGFWHRAEFGAKNSMVLTENLGGVVLYLGGRKETNGFRVEVRLDATDTYTVETYKIGRLGSANYGKKQHANRADGIQVAQLAGTIGRFLFGNGYKARNEG